MAFFEIFSVEDLNKKLYFTYVHYSNQSVALIFLVNCANFSSFGFNSKTKLSVQVSFLIKEGL